MFTSKDGFDTCLLKTKFEKEHQPKLLTTVIERFMKTGQDFTFSFESWFQLWNDVLSRRLTN